MHGRGASLSCAKGLCRVDRESLDEVVDGTLAQRGLPAWEPDELVASVRDAARHYHALADVEHDEITAAADNHLAVQPDFDGGSVGR